MAAPLIVRLVMDAAGYLKTVDTAVGANTKLEQSSLGVGEAMQVSATKSVQASLRATEALQAQVDGYRELAASATESAAVRERATLLANRAEGRLNSSLRFSTAASASRARAVQNEEKTLGKFTRGALAGSGAASSLGRSLAFASGGFLAFAVGSQLVAKSITDAEALAKAQDSLSVAIKHTGGNVQKLTPIYDETAKSAAKFGVTQTDATTGLARATVLTGSAVRAQRAYQEALLISKATGKDFNVVLTAAAKGQEGITTSLRRYGVLVDSTTSGQEQFNKVLARFGGQAAANTTAADKLHASFSNALTTIGTALLPTFDKLANSVANWLTKMNESGKLQRDVASGMNLIKTATTPLIKGIEELSGAVGKLTSAWGYLKKVQSGGGVSGFFAGQIPGAFSFAKTSLQNELFPVQSVISAFSRPAAPPPPPLIKPSRFFPALPGVTAPAGPLGSANPIAVYTKYTQTISEQIAVAQAALTKSTKDDVAAAKAIIARIKRGIARGHYEGASLVQALQDEATQQGVLNSARQAAAAQAAKIAAAKKAAASSYTTPIDLQLAEARAQLTKSTADDVRVEKQILDAAKAALASGKKNKQGQLAALQVMLQAKQAIQSFVTQTDSTFTQPLRLQLALAKAQATGGDQTAILLKMKAALEKALKSAKGNIQKQIDIYDQIAAINQQLGSSAGLGFGTFKQASTKALTAGLGLTPAQRKSLRAKLSQLGPGGTVPGDGVGAGGFIIGPDGRPIQVHQHRRPHHGRGSGLDTQTVSPERFNHLIRVLERTANRPLHVTVDLDGKIIADSTTRHQQRHKRRNRSQRRGPHAGGGG